MTGYAGILVIVFGYCFSLLLLYWCSACLKTTYMEQSLYAHLFWDMYMPIHCFSSIMVDVVQF